MTASVMGAITLTSWMYTTRRETPLDNNEIQGSVDEAEKGVDLCGVFLGNFIDKTTSTSWDQLPQPTAREKLRKASRSGCSRPIILKKPAKQAVLKKPARSSK